jgi:HlyD family secretion protein
MKPTLVVFLVVAAVTVGCNGSDPPIAVGTLERHRIELRAERQESILRLAVQEGDVVKPGDVILELDGRRATALLEQARASRDLAAARLAEVVRGFRHEEIDLAKARLAEAEAAMIRLEPDLARARVLVHDGVEPQSALDTITAEHAAAEAARDAARSSLEKHLNGATVEELDQAEADVSRAEAEIAKLTIDAARLVVTAPRTGTIDALPFRVGDEPPVGAPVAVLLA